jgi:hypothetical protein
VLVRRTSKKIKLTLENTMVMTIEETLLDKNKAKVIAFLGVGVAISHTTIDRAREDEREATATKKDTM